MLNYLKCIVYLTLYLIFVSVRVNSTSISIYVCKSSGSDVWSGLLPSPNALQTDGPKYSLIEGQKLARKYTSKMKFGIIAQSQITVNICPGTYRLNSTWTFNTSDSGFSGYPVVYKSLIPNTVILSGSYVIDKVHVSSNASEGDVLWLSTPPSALFSLTDRIGGSRLFVNGTLATLAQSPNKGSYYFVKGAYYLPTDSKGYPGNQAFYADSDSIAIVKGLFFNKLSFTFVRCGPRMIYGCLLIILLTIHYEYHHMLINPLEVME